MSVNRHSSTENAVTGAASPATSSRFPGAPGNCDRSICTLSAWSITAMRFERPEGTVNVQVSKVIPLMFGPKMRRTLLTGLTTMPRFEPDPLQLLKDQSLMEALMPL